MPVREIADDLALLRTYILTPTIPDTVTEQKVESLKEKINTGLEVRKAQRGFLSRVLRFDPSIVYLVFQLALLVMELIKQIRELRKKPAR